MLYHHTDDLIVRIWLVCTTLTIAYMPSLFVRRIYRERAVGDASIVPLVVLQGISHVWMLYGFMTKTWLPSFPCFLIGDIAAAIYLFIYWKYSAERRRVACIVAVVYFMLAMPTVYVILGGLGYTNQTRPEVAKTQGYICGITLDTLNLVVLKSVYHAVKQRSSASLNLGALLLGTANTIGWFTFGMVTSNWIISGPHTFVMALHIAALIVYVVFRPKENMYGLHTDKDSVTASIALTPKADVAGHIKSAAFTTSSPQFQAMRSPVEMYRW
ncbi:hypothetical protein PHYBOEH_007214 [Phytophthora boehmeriae]|uniref:MtN3-like protein n=1 Tax=Phytophthora boehmeriae TaxID=109152 RepID=A0A8T1WDY8_9STRA|nr:hypothetical protein PHYBOEH_007214 [Phytophthora boehmeriae]